MPPFSFKAIDRTGNVSGGVSNAMDRADLSGILQAQGLFLMECSEIIAEEAGEAKSRSKSRLAELWSKVPRLRKRSVSAKTLSFLTTQFAVMIKSSLPVLESLNLLAAQTVEPFLKEKLKDIAKNISEGLTMSAAFGRHPDVFDEVYLSLLSAGETGGNLDQMLDRLASYQAFRVRMRQNIRSALAYPVVVISVTSAVVVFLLLFVLPTFVEIFAQLNVELPLPTRILIGASELLRQFWWALLAGAGLGYLGLKQWLKEPKNERRFARMQLYIPVIGPLIRNIVMTRTLRTMGSLFQSGVQVLKCLELSAYASGNPVFQELFLKVASEVREGKPISAALAQSPHIPPVVVGMVSTGERTGTLPDIISRVAEFYESETESAIKDLFAAIEPFFIVTLGIMVGCVAVAVLVPLFDLPSLIDK